VGLDIDYDALRRRLGRKLGYNRDSATWTEIQDTDVDDIIQAGLRGFYRPVGLEGAPLYVWSFLRKSASVTLVTTDYDYDLPIDFVNLTEDPVVAAAAGGRLERIPWQDLTAMRARASATGVPYYCSVRPLTPDATTGTRHELLIYPTPASLQAGWTVNYRYLCAPEELDETNRYPLGGALHAQTILDACLAEAELMLVDEPGVYNQKFAESLAASIKLDMEAQTRPVRRLKVFKD
jgi:hypothetical protein